MISQPKGGRRSFETGPRDNLLQIHEVLFALVNPQSDPFTATLWV